MMATAASSGKKRFRPTLWPTLMAVPGILVLLAMGGWQVERMTWKQNLIAERASRLAAPPIADVADIRLPDHVFRRAAVRGSYLHDREMYLAARSLRGNVGYHVMTPLRLASGGVVLVNRGWVPSERKEPGKRAEGQVAGEIAVTGLVRGDDRTGWFTPDNDPGKNTWFFVDRKAMAKFAKLDAVRGWHLVADASKNPGGFPIGGQRPPELPDNHLQYVITWFTLAAALAVIWFLYHWRREEDGPESGGAS